MATNFPNSLDNGTSLPYPGALSSRNNPSLAGVETNQNDAVIATQTKLGTGASVADSGKLLIGTGAGTSAWSGTAPASGLFVGTTDSQTLTNKTLTSPIINSPSITNASITADSLSGFSTPNSGTVYGMSVTSGQIGTTAIKDDAVTLDKIYNPYKFHATRTAAYNTVATTWTNCPFNIVEYDINSNYSNSTYRYTAPVAGYYYFSGRLGTEFANLRMLISLYVNGNETLRGVDFSTGTGGQFVISTVSGVIFLNVGDYVECKYYNSGVGAVTLQKFSNYFMGHLLSI